MTKSFLFVTFLSACSIPALSMNGQSSLGSRSVASSAGPTSPMAGAPTPTPVAQPTAPSPEATQEPAFSNDELPAGSLPELMKAMEAVDRSRSLLEYASKPFTNTEVASFTAAYKACYKEIEAAYARGYKRWTKVLDYEGRSLGSMHDQVCQQLASDIPIYVEKQKRIAQETSEQDAERAEAQRVFANAGLTGDRLRLAEEGGYRGAGNTRMTLPQLRKAKYVFILLGPGDDGYTLRRLELGGDRIIDQRDQGFLTEPGSGAYH